MGDVYIDNTNSSGDLTGADWAFTNGSSTVTETGAAGNAVAELSAGDYVRTNGGTQWYKVASVTDDDNFEITPAFQQANNTAVCNYNNEDGSAADGNAFCHPAQATTDTVRTAGDTIKMRANQTHVLAGIDLIADEDGTAAALITLFGCDSVTDPWSDASDVHVTFDFSDTAFQCLWALDYLWKFENIEVIQSSHNSALRLSVTKLTKIIDCVFRDNATAGLRVDSAALTIEDSEFYSNISFGIDFNTGYIMLKNCALYGGGAGTTVGITATGGSALKMFDTVFGAVTTHSVADIVCSGIPLDFFARRCIFNSATEILLDNYEQSLKSEDHNQVIGAHKSYYWNAIWERSTAAGDPRAGGSTAAVKVTPNASCSLNYKFECMEWEEQAVPASEQTRGVAIQVRTNPGSYPTNTELYLEAEYYDHAANDTVATAVSTAVLAANDTWVWFPVVFTPAQVQKVRYRVYLGTKENAEYYCIDNQLYDADPT